VQLCIFACYPCFSVVLFCCCLPVAECTRSHLTCCSVEWAQD
jgi:hypothetical protein